MDRASYLPILFALIGVIAISLGAATLNTTVRSAEQPATGGSFFGTDDSRDSLFDWRPPSVAYRAFIVLYVVFLFVSGYILYQKYGIEFYVILLLGFVSTLVVIWLLNTPPTLQGYNPEPSVTGPAGNSSTATSPSTPPRYLYLVVVTGILIAVGVLVRTTVGSSAPSPSDRTSEEEPVSGQASAVGRAAGRAATRLETTSEADVTNEVYRAWHEMTQHLSVPNPAANTPTDFADAAVEAGMRSQDVDELTHLFEQARYSGEDVTEQHEQHAIAALRRIEDQYTGEE